MAAPTFIGVQTYPVDGGTLTANTQTITPLGTEQLGDLLVVVAWNRSASGTHSMSTTGGQNWTASTQYNGTTIRMKVFSARFNGTFGVSPVVTFGATTCNEVQYFVYRPDATTQLWAVDTALANTAVSAPGSPFTFTRTGRTPANNNNVTMALFHCIAANTWGTLSGTNWVQTSLGAQYRCTSGSGQSTAYAYQCQGTKAATNNVSLNESASTAGSTHIITFYQYAPTTFFTSDWSGGTILDSGKWILSTADLGQLTVDTTQSLIGSSALKYVYNGSGPEYEEHDISDIDTVGVRIQLVIGTASGNQDMIFAASNASTSPFDCARIYLDAAQTLKVLNVNTSGFVGTAFTYTLNTMYQIEVKFIRNGSIKWRLWDSTGNTLLSAEQTDTTSIPDIPIQVLYLGVVDNPGSAQTVWYGNFAANNGDYPGPIVVSSGFTPMLSRSWSDSPMCARNVSEGYING